MRVPYAGDTRGITHGEACDEFERLLAGYIGVRHCRVVSSGSMANMVAFDALGLSPGDEVITTALCFPTTVTPIVKAGCVPVFVDVTFPTLNVDVAQLESALSSRTRAVVLAHFLGNPFDVAAVDAFCLKHGLYLIEDNCDALGSTYRGKRTGGFGNLSTLSFYPAHHITTGEGGAVLCNNGHWAEEVTSLRDWGRDCTCPPGEEGVCGRRYRDGWDHKYLYRHLGYNAKMTEMQGRLGVDAMRHLDAIVAARRENWAYLDERVDGVKMRATEGSEPSWFAFALSVPERLKVVNELNRRGIQTRFPFAGNITRQPCMDGVAYRSLDLENTDRVMDETFFVGVHHSLTAEQRDYLAVNLAEVL